jgi:tissue kallikrein
MTFSNHQSILQQRQRTKLLSFYIGWITIVSVLLLLLSDNNNDIIKVVNGQPRVIGGTTATRGLYPWYAYGSYYLCGASFIWNDLLITAAHCRDETFRTVYGGGIYLNGTDQTRYPFHSMIRHPLYNGSLTKTQHDIAIIKINGNYTGPIAYINSKSDMPEMNTTMMTMGYGENNLLFTDPNRFVLQHVALDVWSNVSCAQYWTTNTFKNDMHLCSGSTQSKDTCVGDSGSPLLLGTRHVIAGIVSFGASPCAQPNVPAVNTRVSRYAPWIKTQLCFLTSATPPSWCPKNPKCISFNNNLYQCTSNNQCCTNTTCNLSSGLCL